jgi:tRNA pseudouridine55 synthase
MQPSGIFVMNKPVDMSSAGLVAVIKRILGVKKAGHTGTLDPFATGVVVCCVNQATKLARFLIRGDKSYEATLTLGIETDTQDVTGRMTATSEGTNFTQEAITSVLDGFRGDIDQVPPVYSALKHKGKRLYRLARQGRPVQKPARRVHISLIRLLSVDMPDVRFQVTCSAGTYIRTLCADIGEALGCGGHLKQLKRTEACGFHLDEALDISTLEQLAVSGRKFDRMISMTEALKAFPTVVVENGVARKIRYGQPLSKTEVAFESEGQQKHFKVVDRNHRLLAVLKSYSEKSTYDYECVLSA